MDHSLKPEVWYQLNKAHVQQSSMTVLAGNVKREKRARSNQAQARRPTTVT